MRAKFINEFVRGGDPLETLGIGYKAKIHKFFDDIGVDRRDYILDNNNIYYARNLNLTNCNITELPENLTIRGNLNLNHNENFKNLPNNLHIKGDLDIRYTKITKFPEIISVASYIWLTKDQKELIQYLHENNWGSKIRYSN